MAILMHLIGEGKMAGLSVVVIASDAIFFINVMAAGWPTQLGRRGTLVNLSYEYEFVRSATFVPFSARYICLEVP